METDAHRSAGLMACPDCDALYRKPPLREGQKAKCRRCGALLYRQKGNSIEQALMFTLASLVCYGLANVYPLLGFKIQGRVQQTELITGVEELYRQGRSGLAAVVFGVGILIPLVKILSLLYVLLPLHFNRRPWKLAFVFRLVEGLHPWAMLEVYLLGVFVAIVKLASLATIIPGIALYSLGALIVLMAAADAVLEPHAVWERLEVR